MIELIVVLIGIVVFWKLVGRGFALGEKATAATERTSAILEAVLSPERLELVRRVETRREEERAAAELAYRRKRAVVIWIAIGVVFLLVATNARAQVHMGRDGRAHASVIVGPDGAAFPVMPTFCTPGFGPCPVILGPPALPPSPLGYAPLPAPSAQALPPPPLGWVFTRYTVCPEPRDCPVVFVSVAANGLNVRVGPDGPSLMSLVNGTPLLVLTREGGWTLVAPACDLVSTGAFSWTAGVPLNRCL
jgi:hypothetical protein